MYRRQPKGYRKADFPLPHNFQYIFPLTAHASGENSTIQTLFRTSENAQTAENIEVNPKHPSFLEDGGPLIHGDSIVEKLTYSTTINLTKGAIETDKLRAIKFNWMPYYVAFLDSLEAEDIQSATQIEDILELAHATNNKDTFPLFNGTKLVTTGAVTHPLSSVAFTETFAEYGLTTNDSMEGVDWDSNAFWDTLQYKTNAGMMKKVTGKWHSAVAYRDKPYHYFSNRYTIPSVKRGNPYTYCGILIHVPTAGTEQQLFEAADVTNIPHVYVKSNIRFDEWNTTFDQTVA